MGSISKNIIFYITIVEGNNEDHSFLRKLIHTVVPQAIIESVKNEEEALNYFSNCSTVPHLIFLDQDMLNVSDRGTMQLIKQTDGLDKVPVVFLTRSGNEQQKIDFIKQGASDFYSKPYMAQDLLKIVGSVNNTWLA